MLVACCIRIIRHNQRLKPHADLDLSNGLHQIHGHLLRLPLRNDERRERNLRLLLKIKEAPCTGTRLDPSSFPLQLPVITFRLLRLRRPVLRQWRHARLVRDRGYRRTVLDEPGVRSRPRARTPIRDLGLRARQPRRRRGRGRSAVRSVGALLFVGIFGLHGVGDRRDGGGGEGSREEETVDRRCFGGGG